MLENSVGYTKSGFSSNARQVRSISCIVCFWPVVCLFVCMCVCTHVFVCVHDSWCFYVKPITMNLFPNECLFCILKVCTLSSSFTLMTERMQCFYCLKEHQRTGSDLQYRWHGYSLSILMNIRVSLQIYSQLLYVGSGLCTRTQELILFLQDR